MDESQLLSLTSNEVCEFVFEHELEDERKLLLKYRKLFGLPFALIAQQMIGRRKSKEKLPIWYQSKKIVFPPSLNLEQSSSEATARFKADLIASLPFERRNFADLTAGFGVDSFFFSKIFQHGVIVEPNKELLLITQHNHVQLGARNLEYLNKSAEEYTNEIGFARTDFIYIDPSRRKESQKVFKLSECIPNVVELQSGLLQTAKYVLIKTSPLLDIQQALRELKNVSKVIVLAVENEVKELLFLQNRLFEEEPEITAVNLKDAESSQFDFMFSQEKSLSVKASPIQNYLYEPNAAILKAGAFKSIAQKFDVDKIQVNTHLYTSNHLFQKFPGRVFQIESVQPNAAQLKVLLPELKANVITRNYPLQPEELKNKLKLKDGGEKYVIAFSEETKKTWVVATRIK